LFKRRIPTETTGPKTFGDRRHADRRPAAWRSRLLVTEEGKEQVYVSDASYLECQLRDLSTAGVGLHCPSSDLSVGDRVLLDLQLGEHHRATIKVTGEVRHAECDDDGAVRAGIEFVEIGDLERALLLRLVRDLEEPAAQTA
jgi:hypothetical protein